MTQTLRQSKTLWTLFIFSMLGFTAFLILQINCLARDAFLLKEYRQKLNQLSNNNEGLEIHLAQSSSLKNIENYLQSKNFVKAGQVKYIQILEASVAQKNE